MIAIPSDIISAYAGALAESAINETTAYIPYLSRFNTNASRKEINTSNVKSSLAKVAKNTITDGTVNAISNTVASAAIPVNLKSWFIPKKLKSCFMGNFAIKLDRQNLIRAMIGTPVLTAMDKEQRPSQFLFQDTIIKAGS